MAKPPAAPQQPESWRRLFFTLGLAATITSGFGLVDTWAEGKQRTYQEQCTIAQQIVGDETPNPALTKQVSQTIGGLAATRVEQCLGDEK
ncbi:MAG TPA: hypothetical protein VGD66_02185 [Allosphingosinicella sp.]|jgi:hypothetical protein